MRKRISACRRCSECIGQAHHWLEDGYGVACKHCDAIAELCLSCTVGDNDPDCSECQGQPIFGARLGPREGVCVECGCTDEFACEEGCAWANIDQTLCTSCVQQEGLEE